SQVCQHLRSLFYIFFYFNSVFTYIFSILGDEEPEKIGVNKGELSPLFAPRPSLAKQKLEIN
ncbi:hypothetical protein, partial [Microcoleus sp.]|uniref:hypothetical protein n=1 Tax=Microcoleus sp. TaxID=44472 RepID=UPI00403EB4B5